MSSGQPAEAATLIEEKATESGGDQLIYLLDYGTALLEAGEFDKSARAFGRADTIADVKDFMSLSEQTATLLTNDSMAHYRGEIFEVSLINVYSALAYLAMGDLEKAAVECRRINYKLEKLITVGESLKKQNGLARYLSALVWEASGDWDASYIDYHKAYEIDPNIQDIGKRLLLSAKKAQRDDDFQKWKSKFPQDYKSIDWKKNNNGELIVIYQQGWIPRKAPHVSDFRFPQMYPVYSRTQQIKIESSGRQTTSFKLYDLQSVAIKTLEDQFLSLVGKRMLGVAAKHVLADQIDQKNKGNGVAAIALLAMNVMDQADLRQWATLPQTFQVARLELPPGEHEVKIEGVTVYGGSFAEGNVTKKVIINPNKKTFISYRTYL